MVFVVLVASTAHAETRDELQARGEALGREGRWGEAIRAFKSADQLEHRPIHACLIALAYTRREAWPQAEVFLSRCLEPNSGETLPDWVPEAQKLIETRLKSEPLSEVTIEVVPAAAATVTVSSFEPDEVFTPRAIHLPRGSHVIFARAPGFPDRQVVVVVDDSKPRRVVIDFEAPTEATLKRGPKSLRIAGIATVGGGVLAAGLGLYFGKVARDDAETISKHPGPWTDTEHRIYDEGNAAQNKMIAAYIVGGVLVATGGVLYYLGARTSVMPMADTHSANIAVRGTF
jgi:hypothetical protein